jgi:hypothetical protein
MPAMPAAVPAGGERQDAAREHPGQGAIGQVPRQDPGHDGGEIGPDHGGPDRRRRQDRGARALQPGEQPELLPETQHGQMQLAGALQDSGDGADQAQPERRAEGRREQSRQQADRGAAGELRHDDAALGPLALPVRAGIEAAASGADPLEADGIGELDDGDEQGEAGIVGSRQQVGDGDEQAEGQQRLVEIGAQCGDLGHQAAAPYPAKPSALRSRLRKPMPESMDLSPLAIRP